MEYVKYLKEKYTINLIAKSRFVLAQLFQAKLIEKAKELKLNPMIVSFRKLVAISDLDER